MTGDDKAYAFYLILLLSAIAAGYLFSHREKFSKTLQQAMIWGLIFIGVVIAYGFKDTLKSQVFPSSAQVSSSGEITLRRARDGHFYTKLNINDKTVEFALDTGASALVLTKSDAQRVGIDLDNLNFLGRSSTANGEVKTAYAQLGIVRFGPFTDYDVDASINGGDLSVSLLGNDYLQLYSEITIKGDILTLRR